MQSSVKWLRFSVANILIVSCIGALMRYKIGFDFPFCDQKYMQHAHSHFAFSGWVTHTLYTLMVWWIGKELPSLRMGKYRRMMAINLICAYGMLASFFLGGYSASSILFSQASIINSYVFAYLYIKDLKALKHHPTTKWFKAALCFGVFSSLGTYVLAYMMVSRHVLQSVYLGSIYFYLHFQYNGWFFFACSGLLVSRMKDVIPGFSDDRTAFRLFLYSCLPAYLLSALWLDLPAWLYCIVVVASVMQILGWLRTLRSLKQNFKVLKDNLSSFSWIVFIAIAISLTVKFLLQLASVIPAVSQLAFGFRPIVIAYLHLVLLAIISLFLLNFMFSFNFLRTSKLAAYGFVCFTIGVYLNEVLLGIQGIASLSYTLVPKINELLFAVSILVFLSLIAVFASQLKKARQ